MLFIVGGFLIPIRWVCTKMFARFAFGLHHSADFLARVFCVLLIDDIEERGKIAVLLVCAVYAVIDSNKPHAFLRKQDFRIEADFQIITPAATYL